jgi:transposase
MGHGSNVLGKGKLTYKPGDVYQGVDYQMYRIDAIRAFLKERGIKAIIPSKSNRKKKIRHNKQAYKNRNIVERCFCRLKGWRRIATRYDKLAQNFFSALCFVATLAYWI